MPRALLRRATRQAPASVRPSLPSRVPETTCFVSAQTNAPGRTSRAFERRVVHICAKRLMDSSRGCRDAATPSRQRGVSNSRWHSRLESGSHFHESPTYVSCPLRRFPRWLLPSALTILAPLRRRSRPSPSSSTCLGFTSSVPASLSLSMAPPLPSVPCLNNTIQTSETRWHPTCCWKRSTIKRGLN